MKARLINIEGKRNHVAYYLSSLYTMQSSLKETEYRLEKLRVIAEGLRSVSGESVSGGIKRDIADVEHEITKLLETYQSNLVLYSAEIAEGYRLCPTDDLPRYVCWLHWAEHKTWAQVAKRVGYDSDYVRKKLCDRGVESIYNAMPNRWRKPSPEAI